MNDQIRYEKRYVCANSRCRSAGKNSVFHYVNNIPDHETNLGNFSIAICSLCGLGHTNPFPSELTAHNLYDEKSSSDFDIAGNGVIEFLKDFLAIMLLKKISKDKKINSVLDYSTGNGRFAINAAKVFREAKIYAVDYQDTPPPSLQNNTQIKYYKNTDFVNNNEKFDLILLRHVLEHSHDPVELLRSLSRHLTKGGILYIEVPNLNSGCAKLFKGNWKLFYVPRHIFHFTIKSLGEVIEEAGLEASIYKNNPPLMGNTLAIISRSSQSSSFIKIIGIFLYPFQIILEKFYKSSSCLNAICKKS